MDYEALGANGARVSARKFWAAHNGVVVALIGALDADGCAPPVRTALDQCRLRGAVTAADADGVAVIAEPGRRELRGARWIHHAGLLYVPLGGAAVSLTTGPATGSWHEINNNYPDTPVTEPVFLPVMEHGVSPRGASAGFAMLACASAADAEALAARPSWRVLRNDAACQAVRFDDGAMMAAFYEPAEIPAAVPADGVEAPPIPHSEIRIPHSPSLSAAQPCIALVSQGQLFVTDPLRSGRTLTVAVGPLQFSTDCPPDGGVSPPIPINPP
jgi:chondroitin AC lyase